MNIRTLISNSTVGAVIFLAAACSPSSAPPAAGAVAPHPEVTDTASYLQAKLGNITATPATVQSGQKVTLAGKFSDAPNGMPLTASVFSPDGHLLDDFEGEVRGGSFSIAIPDDAVKNPGTYLVDLRTGLLHHGTTAFTVSG